MFSVTSSIIFLSMFALGIVCRELDEGSESLLFALLLAIFLVYVVMACQFESLVQPFVILFSVPLAGVGAAG